MNNGDAVTVAPVAAVQARPNKTAPSTVETLDFADTVIEISSSPNSTIDHDAPPAGEDTVSPSRTPKKAAIAVVQTPRPRALVDPRANQPNRSPAERRAHDRREKNLVSLAKAREELHLDKKMSKMQRQLRFDDEVIVLSSSSDSDDVELFKKPIKAQTALKGDTYAAATTAEGDALSDAWRGEARRGGWVFEC